MRLQAPVRATTRPSGLEAAVIGSVALAAAVAAAVAGLRAVDGAA